MKLGESLEDFLNLFLHFCHEFPEENFDYNFISNKFQSLVLLSVKHLGSEPLDDSTLPTYIDHETPQICEEEPTVSFFPCPPPFSVPIWVPPCDDVEFGKIFNSLIAGQQIFS